MPNMKDVAREAHATVKRCRDRGKTPSLFESSDGDNKQGWSVCELEFFAGRNVTTGEIGNYEEYWGRKEIFLGTDGRLYVYTFYGQQIGVNRGGTGKAELTHRIEKAEVSDLRNPRLIFNVRKPSFQAVLDGLKAWAQS